MDKHVWLALAKDLKARHFLEETDRLHELATSELITLIKRLVKGPDSWSPSYPSAPVIARQQIFHPVIKLGPGILVWENEVKLLPGGKYALFNNWHRLECWNIAQDKLVWEHDSQWPCTNGKPSVLEFAVDLVDDGEAAVILICQRSYEAQRKKSVLSSPVSKFQVDKSRSIVEVVRLEGDASVLFRLPCPTPTMKTHFTCYCSRLY